MILIICCFFFKTNCGPDKTLGGSWSRGKGHWWFSSANAMWEFVMNIEIGVDFSFSEKTKWNLVVLCFADWFGQCTCWCTQKLITSHKMAAKGALGTHFHLIMFFVPRKLACSRSAKKHSPKNGAYVCLAFPITDPSPHMFCCGYVLNWDRLHHFLNLTTPESLTFPLREDILFYNCVSIGCLRIVILRTVAGFILRKYIISIEHCNRITRHYGWITSQSRLTSCDSTDKLKW